MTTMRYAVVRGPLETIQRYLPSNYTAGEQFGEMVLISGHDSAGWTMDDYVIPRLASGLYFAREVTLEEATEEFGLEDRPVAVVDMDSASEPGETYTVVARFATEQEAVAWLGQHPDQDKVERGGFGVDVPEPCCYPFFQSRGQDHAYDCEEYDR